MKNKVIAILIFVIILIIAIGYKLYGDYSYSGELIIIKGMGNNVYHRVDCSLVKKASGKDIKIMSKEEIAREEFRPCKTCNPPYDIKYVLEIRKLKEQEKKAAEAKKAEEHKNEMLRIKEEYISGVNRSVYNALNLYKEKYLSKNDLIRYRPIIEGNGVFVRMGESEFKKLTGIEPIYNRRTTSDGSTRREALNRLINEINN